MATSTGADTTPPSGRSHALTRKLEAFSALDDDDRLALNDWERSATWVAPGQTVAREGDNPQTISCLFAGWAYRHMDFRDGRRQILSFLIPGDDFGGHADQTRPIDHGVRTLTRARIGRIRREAYLDVLGAHPAIAMALRKAYLVDQAVLRAWLVNLGQRHAHERMAHLFCEIAHRLGQRDLLLDPGHFELPLTQLELASALGLTSVHVNRVMQKLRAEGLVEFHDGVMLIRDPDGLRAVAGFRPDYLTI